MLIPYTVTLRRLAPEEGGGWYAEIPVLPGCSSDGETVEEAVSNLEEAMSLWIETAQELGYRIPEPERGIGEFSGKFTVRIPRTLHQDLAREAELENVSLNQYVMYILAERHELHHARKYWDEQGATRQEETTVDILQIRTSYTSDNMVEVWWKQAGALVQCSSGLVRRELSETRGLY